ncbi:MAG: OmpH family outer membrane protein [Legionellales bacterium]|jgi:outer membrane protein|nr:OmpH family outer membrane protein [Legionellales bacterium]
MNIKSMLLSSILLFNLPFALAQTTTTGTTENKVAVVDMHAILDNSPKMDTMRKGLEKQFAKEHDSIAAAQTELQTKAKKIDTDAAVMTKATLAKAKESLQKEQKALQERQIKFQQSVYTAQDNAMKTILDEVTAVVSTLAKTNNYDLVVPKNSTIYVKETFDITEQVKAKLSK